MNEKSFVRNYFTTLWKALTQPNSFFRELPVTGGITGPLAFALVTHWIGATASYLWTHLLGQWTHAYYSAFSKIIGDVAHLNEGTSNVEWSEMINFKDQFFQWFWGTGSIIADPFYTLFTVIFISFFVFLGAQIFVLWLGPSRPPVEGEQTVSVTFESTVRLVCYGMAPMILTGIPLFGWGLATFLSFVITVIGAKEMYRVGVFRAMVIALFPRLVLFTLIAGTLLFIAALLIKVVLSVF